MSTRALQREPRLRHVVFAPPSAKDKPLRVWSREQVIGVCAVGLVHSRPGEGRVRVKLTHRLAGRVPQYSFLSLVGSRVLAISANAEGEYLVFEFGSDMWLAAAMVLCG